MKPILEVHSLSKKFHIHSEIKPYLSVRESISSIFKNKPKYEEFYALNDLNFSINQGDSVAIVGKNGAGKSTLLKILSKITPPTSGKIISRGRIASLLEVGTGFHPELSGRENVFLNGSILGMKRFEIVKNFDAIVDFSGVEKFLDTPLKHYSSGMQLRLAFAVAAFLENEILVLDEVLAVGDSEFQKKCMGKMEEISSNQGRTIVFVSHNMNAINTLCNKGILLKNGILNKVGTAKEIVNYYLTNENNIVSSIDWLNSKPPGDNEAQIISIKLIDEHQRDLKVIDIANIVGVEICYNVIIKNKPKVPNIHVYTTKGECVFVSSENEFEMINEKGKFKSIVWIPANFLNVDSYTISVALSTMTPVKVHFWIKDALVFETTENLNYRITSYNQELPGIIRPKLKWDTELLT